MTLHKEGKGLLIGILVALGIINLASYYLSVYMGDSEVRMLPLNPAMEGEGDPFAPGWLFYVVLGLSIVLYALVLNFFRYIPRKHPLAERNDVVVCPADGKVVVIEEVDEQQILGERCLQVSVFMNVFNMHVNWIPVNGTIEHVSHSPGRFMAAHLPKSSTENERSAVVIRTADGHRVLARQVAGAVAQRIVTYSKEGEACHINDNLGFIKFGSRVDLYLPLGSKVHVNIGQKVDGNVTLIAELPPRKAE